MDNRILRRLIRRAFRELRKDGLICCENFACCTTCASSEISDILDENPGALGAVSWNSQDEDDLRKTGRVMIGFLSSKDDPLLQVQVGLRAAQAFRDAGLEAIWDESPGRKIEIMLPRNANPKIKLKNSRRKP